MKFEKSVKEGHHVKVVDNYSRGHPENLSHHKNNPALTIIEVDTAEFNVMKKVVEGTSWVFHLAALAEIIPSIKDPVDYHRSNVTGTVAVLEAARLAGVDKFVYAASSTCYGIPDIFPTPEDAPIRPMYPYALTKNIGENYVYHWNQTFNLPTISMRLFNVYGPRSRTSGAYGAVFGVFLAQKLNKKPFTVVGDGTQTRDFTYVEDVTSALITASESTLESEIINIGSDNTYSVNRVIELLGGEVVYICLLNTSPSPRD